MINVSKILYQICGDKNVYNPKFNLMESGLLDSFLVIELFSILEDNGIIIHPTRIDRDLLKTPESIQKLVNEAFSKD